MCSWIWQNFDKFSLKCGTVFYLCRTFWERVKVQVMEGSHVRKKYFGHWLINPYPPLTALLSKGSLFTDLATCRDLHSIEFWRPKKEDQVARIGVMGGGLGNSGNARKKTFFLIEAFPKWCDVIVAYEKLSLVVTPWWPIALYQPSLSWTERDDSF